MFSVIGLMEHHLRWPGNEEEWPVFIKLGFSAEGILKRGYLTAELKASHVETVGVMLDADERPSGRYQRIRELVSQLFPNLPTQMPGEGVIVGNEDQKRLGIWLMPDNLSEGDLETFLRYLVPDHSETIWTQAVESTRHARRLGAPCRERHLPKAELYTWLSWQDPPGYSPGTALTKKILDPYSAHASTFVRWFTDLYQL